MKYLLILFMLLAVACDRQISQSNISIEGIWISAEFDSLMRESLSPLITMDLCRDKIPVPVLIFYKESGVLQLMMGNFHEAGICPIIKKESEYILEANANEKFELKDSMVSYTTESSTFKYLKIGDYSLGSDLLEIINRHYVRCFEGIYQNSENSTLLKISQDSLYLDSTAYSFVLGFDFFNLEDVDTLYDFIILKSLDTGMIKPFEATKYSIKLDGRDIYKKIE